MVEVEEEGELVDLTWYNLKEMSSWFIWISCEFIHLASLQRYAALKREAGIFKH